MNIYSPIKPDLQISEIASVVSSILMKEIAAIERVTGGGNNQVYKTTVEDDLSYAIKVYFKDDRRNRLKFEFSSLSFLWQNGITCVPQPIGMDEASGCAIYEYICGQKITQPDIKAEDIDALVNFLVQLDGIKTCAGSRSLPLASDSCFSVREVVAGVEQRLLRLSQIPDSEERYPELHCFLNNDFIPYFHETVRWCQSQLERSQVSFTAEIGFEEQILSPSDFGFHNALRRSNGQIVFLDFEYFGWDDPAKAISDILWHPGMKLSAPFKQRFRDRVLANFIHYRHLTKRVEIVYPLCGLKWCLLVLNEFVPEYSIRRGFANASDFDLSKRQAEQLAKAKHILGQIIEEHERSF
jgi:Phosphotransferase enzyme family